MSIFVSDAHIRKLAWHEACERQRLHDEIFHGPKSLIDHERKLLEHRVMALEMRLNSQPNPNRRPLRAEDV